MKKKLDYAKDLEAVAQKHAFHCRIHDIPFERRTLYSCSCPSKTIYQKEFEERRENLKSESNENDKELYNM
jgi:hypothetical protein